MIKVIGRTVVRVRASCHFRGMVSLVRSHCDLRNGCLVDAERYSKQRKLWHSVNSFDISSRRHSSFTAIANWPYAPVVGGGHTPLYCHLSTRRQSPYQVLEVSPSATEKEIKLAYYHLAKRYHPDLHRDKPFEEQVTMKKKFQEVSAAYEYLNTVRQGGNASWDSGGGAGGGAGPSGGSGFHDQQHYSNANPEDIFNSVLQDSEILTEVFGMMLADMQAEFGMAMEAAGQGDFDYLWEIAKANKGIIFGVVIPTTLIVRFPALIPVVARWVMYAAQTAFVGLLQSGKTKQLSMMLWSQIIRNSEMQISYLQLKEKKRQEKLNEYQRKNRGEHTSSSPESNKHHSSNGTSSSTSGASTSANSEKKSSAYTFRWKSKK